LLENKRWSICLPNFQGPILWILGWKLCTIFFWPGCYSREDWTSHPVRKDC
jgi:hypothetical protein